MKLSTLLLAALAPAGDAKRDQSLLTKNLLMRQNGYTTGGNLKPKRLEDEITNVREQSRMYPFCSSGTPETDNCYRKCKGSSNCQAELVYYSPDQQNVFNCRKSTPKHIPKADACVKLANKNALVNGQIEFNGEVEGYHVHKTVEINAPADMFIQLTVEDFNIGAKELDFKTPGMNGHKEKCGYGGIFVFSGQGAINQMVRITEFCGTKDDPVIDYVNEKYGGEKEFYTGVTAQIQSSRVIIAIMTNEHFDTETIGAATATIKWDIVSPPESELIRGIDYLTDAIGANWKRIACEEAPDLANYEEGMCMQKHSDDNKLKRKYRKFSRYYKKTMQILDKAPKMAHLKCYANGQGPAVLLPKDSQLITDFYAAESTSELITLIQNLLAYLMRDCKLQVFWNEKMEHVRKIFNQVNKMST